MLTLPCMQPMQRMQGRQQKNGKVEINAKKAKETKSV